MRVHITMTVLAVSGILFVAGCSSADEGTAANSSGEPLKYCEQVAPLWDTNAIPNYDDAMSGAERDTAAAQLTSAIEALPQGVDLGALAPEQASLLVSAFSVILEVYKDPALADSDLGAAAEAAGLTAEEFAELSASPEAEAALDALNAYCVPGGAPAPSDVAVEE